MAATVAIREHVTGFGPTPAAVTSSLGRPPALMHDLGLILVGVCIGLPVGALLDTWLRVSVVPALIRHGRR